MRPYICCVLFVLTVASTYAFRKQKLTVTGQLFCGSPAQPAEGVRVKVVDDDTGPDPDDELEAGYADKKGRFRLSGSTREFTNIDGYLKIYHDCNDHNRPCQRRWKIGVPDKYINAGTFDIGHVNLEVQLEEEERDCIH